MKLYMLYEDRLGTIPEAIKTVEDFGPLTILVEVDDRPTHHVKGTSLVLEGPTQAFINWLRPFDHVWLGDGQPCEERFRVANIKEDA